MASVALGNFDGVHLAHQTVLKNAARRDNSICLMFREHPLAVLTGKAPARILSRESTEKKIFACGISRCEYLDFAAIKELSPAAFFEKVLLERYHAEAVSCGYNYTFGKDRSGDVQTLQSLCEKHGVALMVAAQTDFEGEAVSSSRIRACIRRGEIEKANAMLGEPFCFEGEIVAGKRLGRKLGFPTINQYFAAQALKPLSGVYAARVSLGGKSYRALTNIGNNPTIGSDGFRSESYLFDFDADAYGQTAATALLRFIRPEQTFESIEALKTQVLQDIERAKDHV